MSQAGSNHPLRGTKGTLFEGGTHGVGFVTGGKIARSGVVEARLYILHTVMQNRRLSAVVELPHFLDILLDLGDIVQTLEGSSDT